jgi:hypothetical protein
MNREQFIQFIDEPKLLNKQSLEDLRMLIDEFPYFQTAWLLYAQNLKAVNDVRFESQLKQAAIHIADRSILFRIIHDKVQSELVDTNKTITSATKSEDKSLDQVIKERLLELQKKEEHSNEGVKKNTEFNLNASSQVAENQEELIDFAFDTEQNAKVLDQMIRSEVQRVYTLEKASLEFNEKQSQRNKKIDLIDRFIENEERGFASNSELPLKDTLPEYNLNNSEDFISETLAKIYIKQAYFEKALYTYEKLSLKYPEKNIYFAAQIKMLKELIKKTK